MLTAASDVDPLILMNPDVGVLFMTTTALAPALAAFRAFVENVHDPLLTNTRAFRTACAFVSCAHASSGSAHTVVVAAKACVDTDERAWSPLTSRTWRCVQCAARGPETTADHTLEVHSSTDPKLFFDCVTPTARAFFALEGALYVFRPCESSRPEFPMANRGRKVSCA